MSKTGCQEYSTLGSLGAQHWVVSLDHYVKIVQKRSFFGSCFPVFGVNTEINGVNLRIQTESGKIRNRKNSIFRHFSRSGCLSEQNVQMFWTRLLDLCVSKNNSCISGLWNWILVKFLLTATTEKFSFVFFSDPCLIFHILSPNHSLVNVYKLLCCIFIILFLILIKALFVKWSFSKFWGNCHHFIQVFL